MNIGQKEGGREGGVGEARGSGGYRNLIHGYAG